MRTVILSDIHGNRQALEAVRDCGVRLGVDSWVCLGDIVGYGADPSFCIDGIRALSSQVVLGNHDAAAIGLQDLQYFNEYARRAVEWTAARLTEAEDAYLRRLPLTLECGDALCVHAEPARPQEWFYVHSRQDARVVLENMACRLCFIGHTHMPFICTLSGEGLEMTGSEEIVAVAADQSYLINVGSVGQPRDGDPRACFLLWDEEENMLELLRTDYDIAGAQESILDAGLPPFLAQRLAIGQ